MADQFRKSVKKGLAIIGLLVLAAIGLFGLFGIMQERIGEFSPIHWMLVFGILVLPPVLFGALYLLRFVYRFVTKPEVKVSAPDTGATPE